MDEEKTELALLLEIILRAIVDDEEAVFVKETPGKQVRVLEIRVAKKDLGKIIGKSGRMAKSLRNIMLAASAKKHIRTLVEILED